MNLATHLVIVTTLGTLVLVGESQANGHTYYPNGLQQNVPISGGWMTDHQQRNAWIRNLKEKVKSSPRALSAPILQFKELVDKDPVLNQTAKAMFLEAGILKNESALGTPEVETFEEFLVLLNGIMTQAPQFTECYDGKPCYMGFLINALLIWPMATDKGYNFFSNEIVNQQFNRILKYWGEFLGSKNSRYVLVDHKLIIDDNTPKVFAWLSDRVKQDIVNVACQASEDPNCCNNSFEYFFNCDPKDPYYGFQSWDDFFTRTFKEGVRPVADGEDVIANACESAPLQVKTKVSESSNFWLKGQEYSLENMMDFDPLYKRFIGGTVYQAFLSVLSFHRWNSPVTGTIRKTKVVKGSYYLENRYGRTPKRSQPFLSAVATRALIFIEADNPKIGLMCFIAIGMSEVSSCDIKVKEGQHVVKGEELGMFHFGGSTHCLIFRPDVKLEFDFHNTIPGLDATNIPVNSRIATVLD